jgi:hypothetical protein
MLASKASTGIVKLHFKNKNFPHAILSQKETLAKPAIKIPSTALAAHAPLIFKKLTAFPPSSSLRKEYEIYTSAGSHAYKNQALFKDAHFFVRHGGMHAAYVSLNVRPVINLYREMGDDRIAKLSFEEITALEVAALYHDYGRVILQNDLGSDTNEMEQKGAQACYIYLTEKMGIPKEIAMKARNAILNKDIENNPGQSLENKCIFAEILQNCDCLAVLRADDWKFNSKYLNVMMRIQAGVFAKPDSLAKVYELIDNNKKFLIAVGDSPYDMQSFIDPSQTFRGHFSLATKHRFEMAPNCYQLMKDEMLKFPYFQKINI